MSRLEAMAAVLYLLACGAFFALLAFAPQPSTSTASSPSYGNLDCRTYLGSRYTGPDPYTC